MSKPNLDTPKHPELKTLVNKLRSLLSETKAPEEGGTGTSETFTQGSILFVGASGVYAQNNTQLFWDDLNRRIGIGTKTPSAKLHVKTTGVVDPIAKFESTEAISISVATDINHGEFWIARQNDQFGLSVLASDIGLRCVSGQSIHFGSGSNPFAIFSDKGLCIGGTSFGASADAVLAIEASTAPTTSPTNTIQIFAVDVAGSHEARVRDEGGTTTTFSPHNFSLFQPEQSFEFPWSYYSRNDYLGKEINVDMFGVVRALEELTGKQFIFLRDLEKQEWDSEKDPPEWLRVRGVQKRKEVI